MRPDWRVYLSSRLTRANSAKFSAPSTLPRAVYCIPRGSTRICPYRHGRTCSGHPDNCATALQLDRDRRDKPGDDLEASNVADFVYEITCTAGPDQEGAVQAWADREAVPVWTALPELSAVDLYQPMRGGTHDPFNSDGPGPLLIAMLQFPTRQKLEAGLADPRFKQSVAARPAVTTTGTSFERW